MSADEAYRNAIRELKRAEHSILVSLKYTRTVDVIKSIIERLINAISYGLDTILEKAKAEKKTAAVPSLPRLKVEQVRKLYEKDAEIQDLCNFFLLLRKIDKVKYSRAQEFRRNVTMTAHMDDGSNVEITIDIITDYYEKTVELLDYIGTIVNE